MVQLSRVDFFVSYLDSLACSPQSTQCDTIDATHDVAEGPGWSSRLDRILHDAKAGQDASSDSFSC